MEIVFFRRELSFNNVPARYYGVVVEPKQYTTINNQTLFHFLKSLNMPQIQVLPVCRTYGRQTPSDAYCSLSSIDKVENIKDDIILLSGPCMYPEFEDIAAFLAQLQKNGFTFDIHTDIVQYYQTEDCIMNTGNPWKRTILTINDDTIHKSINEANVQLGEAHARILELEMLVTALTSTSIYETPLDNISSCESEDSTNLISFGDSNDTIYDNLIDFNEFIPIEIAPKVQENKVAEAAFKRQEAFKKSAYGRRISNVLRTKH